MKRSIYTLPICLLWSILSMGNTQPINQKQENYSNQDALRQIIKKDLGEGFLQLKEGLQISARDLFQDYTEAFGIRQGFDELRFSESKSDALGYTHYRFQQFYKGIEVEAAEMLVHEFNGKVKSVNGDFVPEIELGVTPSLTEEEALNAALASINAQSYMWEDAGAQALLKKLEHDQQATYYPKGDLVILASNLDKLIQKNTLAYKFDIYAAQPEARKDIYIDAHTGKVLLSLDQLVHENYTGTAETLWEGTVNMYTDHFEGGFRLNLENYRDSGADILTYNANKTQPIDFDVVTDFVDDDNHWDNITPEFDEVAPGFHHSAQRTYDYFFDIHGRNSIDNEGKDMVGYMHVGNNWFNASWNGNYMQFGDGGGGMLTTIAVVSHEFTHGVTGSSAGLIYSKESGALNESFSDIFGVSVEFFALPDRPREEVWDIGIRSLKDPKAYGDPNTYQGQFWHDTENNPGDNYGVHTNSGVQNYWFYLLSDGGEGTNDNNDDYQVTGIGDTDAQAIAYRNLTTYLTKTSGYAAARIGSMQAAEDLFGICSPQFESVVNAWHAVGVGGKLDEEDFAVLDVTAPVSGCDLTNNEHIKTVIKYIGNCSLIPAGEQLTISFKINQGNPVVENYILPNDLNSGDEFTYESSAAFDFSDGGDYDVEMVITFDGDDNVLNNEYTKQIENTKISEDFDIGVVAVYPLTSCSVLSASETISIDIINNGCVDIAAGEPLSINYQINGGQIIVENTVLPASLVSGDVAKISFSTKADLSGQGMYELLAACNYNLDPLLDNNILNNTIAVGPIAAGFTENFENGNGGWTHMALQGNDIWELGTPDQMTLNAAHSGTNAWMTNLDGNYQNMSDLALISPCFDMSGFTHPGISFWLHFQLEEDWDGMILEYTTNDEQWNRIGVEGYNSEIYKGNLNLLSQPWFSGENGAWTKYNVYLPSLVGEASVRFRFRFASDQFVTDEGVAIDDFYVGSYEASDFDLALTQIVSPHTSCGLSDAEPFVVEITNKGIIEDNFVFDIAYNFDGQGDFVVENLQIDHLGINETTQVEVPGVTFDLTEPKNYFLSAGVLFDPDEDNDNDYIIAMPVKSYTKITSLPYSQQFEDGDIPATWSKDQALGSTGWQLGTSSELASVFFPVTDLDGDPLNQIMASNDDVCSCDMSEDRLISPAFDVSNYQSAVLTCKAFYNGFQGSSAYINVSSDLGETWTEIYQVPIAEDWQDVEVDLTEYIQNECLMIAFHHDDNGKESASGFAIDQVRIDHRPDFDLAVLEALLPMGCFTAPQNISIRVKNEGTQPVSNFNVQYAIDGGDPVIELISETLESQQELTYTFDAQADLSQEGTYIFDFEVLLDEDEVAVNNSLNNVALNNDPIAVYPSTEDFESDLVWVNVTSDDTNWELNSGGTPTPNTGPSDDHTPGPDNINYMYVESSDQIGKEAILQSACYSDLTSMTNPYFEFWYHLYGSQMGSLSLDVYSAEQDQWHLDVRTYAGNQGNQWVRDEVNLKPYGQVVHFRFRANTGNGFTSDIAIDDLSVYDAPDKIDVAILSGPESGCDIENSSDLYVTIKNFSTGDVSDQITLSYNFDFNPIIFEMFNVNLGPEEEYKYYLTAPFSVNAGEHTFIAQINMNGDEVAENNILNETPFKVYDLAADIFEEEVIYAYEGKMIGLDPTKAFEQLDDVSFNWSPPSPYGNKWFVTEEGTYKVNAFYPNGCNLGDYVFVDYEPVPPATFVDGTHCGPVLLDAGNFSTYLWQDLSTNKTFHVTETGLYYVTVSDAQGRYTTYSAYIVIKENTIVPKVVFEGSTEICEGESVVFEAVFNENYQYQWYHDGNMIDGAKSPTYEAQLAGYYHVMIYEGQCEASSTPIEVVLLSNPGLFTINVEGDFCEGEMATMETAFEEGYVYQWYYNNEPIVGAQTHVYNTDLDGSYYVEVTIGECKAESMPVDIVFSANPVVPTINVLGDAKICEGESVLLEASFVDGVTYSWSNGVEDAQQIAVQETGEYFVTITNGDGCSSSSETVLVEVLPNPMAELVYKDNTVLIVNEGYDNYTWYLNEEAMDQVGNSHEPQESGSYYVDVEQGNCTISSNVVEVNIDNLIKSSALILENNILVNPNPTSGTLFIELGAWSNQEVHVKLIGARGEILLDEQSNGNAQFSIDLSPLASGVYMLQLEDEMGARYHVRVVRE